MDALLSDPSAVISPMGHEWAAYTQQEVPEPPKINRETRRFTSIEEAREKLKIAIDPRLRWCFEQPRFDQRTEQWYKARREGITASDFAAAAGIAEYGSPTQIYRKKVETAPEVFSEFARRCMDHGVKYEDAAAHRYERETGNTIIDFGLLSHWKLWAMRPATKYTAVEWFDKIHEPDKPDDISSSDWDIITDLRWVKGSPDGITANGILIEIKCPSSKFTPGEIKDMYKGQVMANMEQAGVDICHFIQYVPQQSWIFGERYDMFEVHRDGQWYQIQKGKARQVWDWICFTRKTGQIHPDVASKLRLADNSTGSNVILESTRKRPASRESSVTSAPPPSPAMLPFPKDEQEWRDPVAERELAAPIITTITTPNPKRTQTWTPRDDDSDVPKIDISHLLLPSTIPAHAKKDSQANQK